jgi:hypothetical protein
MLLGKVLLELGIYSIPFGNIGRLTMAKNIKLFSY